MESVKPISWDEQSRLLYDRWVRPSRADEGELDPGPTIRKSRIVQMEGDREVARDVELYNLDVIISVGYRVKSHRGTQFRIPTDE